MQDGYFTKIECIVKYRGWVILKDHKYSKTGLWMVPLDMRISPMQTESSGSDAVLEYMQFANFAHEYLANIIPTSSQEELAMYYH